MLGLASETGWSEDFIRDELPLARLLLYQQAHLRRNGIWTVYPVEPVTDQAVLLGVTLPVVD